MFSEEVFLKKYLKEGYDSVSPLLKDYSFYRENVPTFYELQKTREALSLKLSSDIDCDNTLVLRRSPVGVEYKKWDTYSKMNITTGDYQCEEDKNGKQSFKKMTQLLPNKGVVTFKAGDNNIYYYSPETMKIIFGSDEISKFMITTIDKERLENVGIIPDDIVSVKSKTSQEELLRIFMELSTYYKVQLKLKLD